MSRAYFKRNSSHCLVDIYISRYIYIYMTRILLDALNIILLFSGNNLKYEIIGLQLLSNDNNR
jgi:hypothetical protein